MGYSNGGRRAFKPGYDRYKVGLNKLRLLGEFKFFETALDEDPAGAAVIEDSLVHIAQGDAENQRTGRTITIRGIHIRGYFEFAENATQSTETVRMMIVLDKQCNGTAAVATDILETDNPRAFKNLANTSRFVTLLDRYFTMNALNADAASNYGAFKLPFIYNKKCSIPIHYNSTTGVIAEIRSNNILTLIANEDQNVALKATARVRFTDN